LIYKSNLVFQQALIIRDVYPGIDWAVYKTANGGFKYDFIVSSAGDYTSIRLKYLSREPVLLAENGQLEFNTLAGQFQETAPVSFISDTRIASRFRLLRQNPTTIHNTPGYETVFKFDVNDFKLKPEEHLIIDPELVWATYFGGYSDETVQGTVTDAANNFYVTGYTQSPDFPTENSGGNYFQGFVQTDAIAYISKFSPTQQLLWSTFYGGNGISFGENVEIDPSGNIYMAGCTNNTDFPLTNANGNSWFQSTMNGMTDVFIVRFSPAGAVEWSTLFGGNQDDRLFDVTIDNTGNLFLCGRTASTNFPTLTTNGAYFQSTNHGTPYDGFVVKFSSDLELVWSTYFGGTQEDILYGITTDAQGNLFIGGETWSSNFPLHNANNGSYYQAELHGGKDAVIVKCSNDGHLLWSTLIGGYEGEEFTSITSLANGDIWLGGQCESPDFPLFSSQGNCSFQENSSGGSTELILLHISNEGVPLWSTYIPGSSFASSRPECLHYGQDGFIYYTGQNRFVNDLLQEACEGGYSVLEPNNAFGPFILRFTPQHSLTWSSFIIDPSNKSDFFFPETDGQGSIYLAGTVGGSLTDNFPFTNPGNNAFFNSSDLSIHTVALMRFIPLEYSAEANVTTKPFTCIEAGSAEITVVNGCPPFTYTLSGFGASVMTNCPYYQYNNLSPGEYQITSVIGNDTLKNSFIISGDCQNIVVVPNVFTPEMNGMNDFFTVTHSEGILVKGFNIVNRWGETVFSTTDLSVSWDGTLNGKECSEGVYFWNLEFHFPYSDNLQTKSGFLHLIR
jgi:gliding motility-associated-like protein